MKNSVLIMLLVSFVFVNNSNAQRKYIDLSGCEGINNSDYKPGWSLEFRDEFNGGASTGYAPGTGGSGCDDEYFIIVNSDQQWRWKWDTYGEVGMTIPPHAIARTSNPKKKR
jgi:hypothetical protein